MVTLDLHGYTKSEALSRTTWFLDQTNMLNSKHHWVLIITGTGAHSSHGPVLRGAVEALLVKRNIEYHSMKGKASFLVNAASGLVLYEPPQPKDSKVVVAPKSASLSLIRHRSIRGATLGQDVSEKLNENLKTLKKEFHNRRKEEEVFHEVISKSLEDEERLKAEDKELIERAYNLSLLEKEKEVEEDRKLQEAIETAKHESIIEGMDEEEQIQKTLALSKLEFDHQSFTSHTSQMGVNIFDNEMMPLLEDSSTSERDQEDEGLLRALELSVVDF